MKIVCDNKIPFLKGVLEPYAEVVYLPGKETTADAVRDADALITRTRTRCDASLLEGSKVKVIATATIGYDHIDTECCSRLGILWRNAPGCNSWSVEQYICSLLVFLTGKYKLNPESLTLGVIGVGNVGGKVARAAGIMGMKVLLNDPPRARREGPEAFVSLDEIIASSDIISIHVPLTKDGQDATWHLFDETMLSRMKPNQILVNAARGPVVDNKALKNALREGRIRGASLDCWEGEPEIDCELMSMLDISTAHIAGYSADGKANGTASSVRTVSEALDLPLKDWSPKDIPSPRQSRELIIDAGGKSRFEIISEAIWHSYDITEDSSLLRSNPESFEKLRGDYQIRREFTFYSITLKNAPAEYAEALQQLGFKVNVQ